MEKLIRIIAADDHRLFLEGLESLFEMKSEFDLIAICEDGDSLLSLIAIHKPDIALVDISMPGGGIESIVKTVEENYPDTQLIALTMHLEPVLAEKLIALGLCGYVLKEEAFDDLGNAIHALSNGEQFISPTLLDEMQNHKQKELDKDEVLTIREVDVLSHAAQGQTNKEIARLLDISERTVRFHVSNCCIKLTAQGRSNAVAKALKRELISI